MLPIEVINDTQEIIKINNIKIPITSEAEAIRYAESLPSLWVVSISSGIVDDGLDVEFPPDCSYTNIYHALGGVICLIRRAT
jgi:hypothetical protein